jgi:hypothetical protein
VDIGRGMGFTLGAVSVTLGGSTGEDCCLIGIDGKGFCVKGEDVGGEIQRWRRSATLLYALRIGGPKERGEEERRVGFGCKRWSMSSAVCFR